MTNAVLLNLIQKMIWIIQKTNIIKLLIKLPFSIFQNLNGIPSLEWNSFIKKSNTIYPAIGNKKGTVALFTGCLMNNFYSETHLSTLHILQWNGYEVHIPKEQSCCGALDSHYGNNKRAVKLYNNNMRIFNQYNNYSSFQRYTNFTFNISFIF